MIQSLLAILLCAAPADTLAYRFAFEQSAGPPRLVVELRFRGASAGTTTLVLPSQWANQRELWRSLDSLTAQPATVGVEPAAEPWRRRLVHRPGELVTVRYVLRQDFAAPLDRTNWYRAIVQPDHVHFVGQAALAYPEADPDRAVELELAWTGLQPDWVAASSHGVGREVRVRTSLAQVTHAVYAAGAFRLERRTVAGTDLGVALYGTWPFRDAELADRIAAVVDAERGYWREATPWRYLVTALGAGEGANFGGTRLHQSFALFLGPSVTPGERLTRLLAHELMHEWIGGRLRAGVEPEALMYWWTEGFTDFFAERVLWRAGLLDDSAYAGALNAAWRELAFSPARHSPFDSVAARFWTDDAAQRLPYLRGHLFAVALDDRVGKATAGHSSLEAVVGSLVAGAGATGRAMTDSVLAAALRPAFGDSAAPLIAREIRDGLPLPAPDTLLGGCFVRRIDSLAPFALGFDLDQSAAMRRVSGVDSAGPAFAAGMRDGQVLRGWSVRRGDPSQDAEFVVEADGVRRTVRYEPVGKPRIVVPQYAPGIRCSRARSDGYAG